MPFDAPLEQRLRRWVRKRVDQQRGGRARLAEALGRDAGWVTTYLDESGRVHPDLDTTLAIARHFHMELDDLTGLSPLPELDPHTLRLLDEWNSVPPSERDFALALVLRVLEQVTRRAETPLPNQVSEPDSPKRAGRKSRRQN